MAYISGNLGGIDISATTATNIYAAPAATRAAGTVTVVNKSTTVTATIRLTVSTTSATQGATKFIAHGIVLSPSGSNANYYSQSGVVVGASKFLIGYSDVANVVFLFDGVEEAG